MMRGHHDPREAHWDMTRIDTIELPQHPDYLAPDGSEVRLLCAVEGASTAEFLLPPARTTRAVVHHTVDEIWFVTAGSGELWRGGEESSKSTRLTPGICVTIPVGTA